MPTPPSKFDLPLALLLGVIALGCAWVYRNFTQDDAFITYRYARNIAAGHGFVYNAGEPVLGTTTPLYTLVLALGGRLTGQAIHQIGYWLSTLSLWISGVTLYSLGKSRGAFSAAAIALLFITNPLLISSIGMETFFLLMLLLLALRSYAASRFTLTGVLLGLLILTRYETILMAGLLGADCLLRARRRPFWLAWTAVIVGAWLLYAWLTFGQVIPQSAIAKLTEQRLPFALGVALFWRLYTDQTAWSNALLPLSLFGLYSALRQKWGERVPAYLLLLIWSGVYGIAASLYAGSFPWYYAPLIPGFSILVVWGLEFLTHFLSAPLRRLAIQEKALRYSTASAFALGAAGLIALHLFLWTRGWVSHNGQIVDTRYWVYRDLAEWLNRHARAEDSLAASEIGVVGYYTELSIIDLHGLVTPGLTPWLAEDPVEIVRRAIDLYAPDYVLVTRQPVIADLLRSKNYRPVRSVGDQLDLYQRASAAEPRTASPGHAPP
jgi:4-amino-4-deoxy-L-arabinose transferase-like glycosyltransferase